MDEQKRLHVYETPDVTVTFDPNICAEVIEQVARCPSGALQIRRP